MLNRPPRSVSVPLAALALAMAASVSAQTPAPSSRDGVVPAQSTASPEGDASVRTRLEAESLGYEVDVDGDFRILVGWQQENRSQLTFVSGRTHSLGTGAVREVFSAAARVPAGGFSAEQANLLLRDSQTNVLGAWEIDGDVLFYVIKVYDDADSARLREAVDMAAQTADDMEIQLSGGRDEL
ncbi:hypothetical protein [Luteimonas sp. 3794]|uniref:hypothetical protein n=1 Tax=Luteimonas sp. 3794 TaxID=2817730 RepID=UPI002863BFA3|nr:hypothetical protein [Luteimonas sp. 3794]MDR6990895.1 hypothetical protein [Luteimonas sp. 3794]